MTIQGLPGGGVYALTTTEAVLDLSAFAGYEVTMSCGADWTFSFAPASTVAPQTLVVTAAAGSLTALVGDPVGGTIKVLRTVVNKYAVLVAKVLTGTGTLVVKPTRVV